MKGRNSFTTEEANTIRRLLTVKRNGSHDDQKRIRRELREIDFYITDFREGAEAFTARDFDALVARGEVKIAAAAASPTPQDERVTSAPAAKATPRANSDESYVIDLSDEVLGMKSLRQHRFDFLVGDAGTKLPVDAWYPAHRLVIEYREHQHSTDVPFFDRRDTVSGVGRGEQRRLYDQRRRELLPQHGIALVEIDYDQLSHAKNGRLQRSRDADLSVIQAKLRRWINGGT